MFEHLSRFEKVISVLGFNWGLSIMKIQSFRVIWCGMSLLYLTSHPYWLFTGRQNYLKNSVFIFFQVCIGHDSLPYFTLHYHPSWLLTDSLELSEVLGLYIFSGFRGDFIAFSLVRDWYSSNRMCSVSSSLLGLSSFCGRKVKNLCCRWVWIL
jgi:hypothetical protein